MTIIEAKRDKTDKGQNEQLLLNYLSYRDSNQIMIYLDCNRLKGYFDYGSLKNTYTDPLTFAKYACCYKLFKIL